MASTSKGLNCESPLGSITVDSNIVGPGALAAFFVTAVITTTAVTFGYLSGSLGDEFNSDLDRHVINWAETKCRSFKCPAPPPTTSGKGKSHEARKQPVTQFILALSDQQLVAGLAILISGISNQKQLSGYEFSVVLCLAWFSSTTHLATLDALRPYLRSHGVIRDIRVFAMVVLLVLLLYSFCVTIVALNLDSTIPVHRHCRTSDGAVDSSVRIWLLYFDDGTTCRIISRMSKWLPCGDRKSTLLIELALSDEQHIQVWHAVSRASRLRFLLSLPYGMRQDVKGGYLVEESFLSSLTGIAYSFAYGISQVIFYRWLGAPSLDADTNYMGFGQIMAIFLLVLPFFAAAESYHDYTEKVSQTMVTVSTNETTASSQQSIDGSNAIEQRAEVDVSNGSDIQRMRTAWNRLLVDIVNYLAPDVFLMQHFEAQQTTVKGDEQNVLDEAKASVLIEYLRLKDCEKEVTIFSAMGYFTFTLFTWVAVEIILNISTSNAGFIQGLISVMFFAGLVGGNITNVVRRVYTLSCRPFIDGIALHKLEEQIDRGHGNTAPLTQIRRGATGLVEEGYH
ncbi:uncharacterized protein B0J16DRAFT_376592 [Fusarium flagelliforme]|uniref:uncharacterized protein n=1 Tax=Fusarium flagelliforme TaxID=2675880 RepID=UPI001E8CCE39|nr:uncharacterized protein B0J16DRAFT_376592 [Fusarium flagelliforme]KAH7174054.1 hypothetical protein B0J16DRAFT_376592 [Fusarium flagelliforme]